MDVSALKLQNIICVLKRGQIWFLNNTPDRDCTVDNALMPILTLLIKINDKRQASFGSIPTCLNVFFSFFFKLAYVLVKMLNINII